METVVEQNRSEVIRREDLEEAGARVEAYLRAWGLSEKAREEILAVVLERVEQRRDGVIGSNGEPHSARSARADSSQRDEFHRLLRPQRDGDLMRAAIEEAEKEARGRFEEMGALPPLVPQRPPETRPMTMETSLNHLPSFRMIAGWFVIIALIVLAFIFTR